MTICRRTRPNERGTAMEPYPHHPQRHVFVARTSEDTSHRAGGQMRGPPQHGPQCYACVLESMESWEVPLARVDGDTITIDDRHRANVAKRPRDLNDAYHTYPVHMSPADWIYSRIVKEREDRARSVLHLTDNGRSWQRQFIDAYMRRYRDGERASFARRRHIVDGLIGHTLAEPFTAITNRVVRQGSVAEILGLLGESWFSEDETGVYVLMPTLRRHRTVVEVTRIASREEFEKSRRNLIATTVDAMREKLPAPQWRVEGVDRDGSPVSEVLSEDPGISTKSFSRIDRITHLVPVGGGGPISVGDPAGFIEGQEYELPMIGGVDLATSRDRSVVHTMRVTKVTPEPFPAGTGPVAETFDPGHARRVFLTKARRTSDTSVSALDDMRAAFREADAENRIEDHIANERSTFLGIPVVAHDDDLPF